jgi:hypothetical protein
MITAKIKAIEVLKARVARLQAAIDANLDRELARLPGKFRFDSVEDFIAAVEQASGGKRGGKVKVSAVATKRRTRTKITPAIRATVKKLAKAGNTGSQIAKAVGISLPSVQNIKKALGLVRGAKKSVGTPKARQSKAKPKVVSRKTKKRAVKTKAAAPAVKPAQSPVESAAPTPAT